jgi:histidinol dehydrogenase
MRRKFVLTDELLAVAGGGHCAVLILAEEARLVEKVEKTSGAHGLYVCEMKAVIRELVETRPNRS